MATTSITRKNKASTVYEEKKLLDTDVNQILDAIQDGSKDIKTRDVIASGVIKMTNVSTPPTTNPTGGGILYVENGALKYRGPNGTVTTIANP